MWKVRLPIVNGGSDCQLSSAEWEPREVEINYSLATLGESWRWAEEDVFIILAVHLGDRGKNASIFRQLISGRARRH